MSLKKYSNWIWNSDYQLEDEERPVTVLFRKTVTLDCEPTAARLQISAASRYKLYVNEALVEVGPQKGDGQIWYADRMDIATYLKQGENAIAVSVIHFPQKPSRGNQSIISTATPGLYVVGEVELDNGNEKGSSDRATIDISTDESWKTLVDSRVTITPGCPETARVFVYENVVADARFSGWKSVSYDDHAWQAAKPYGFTQIRSTISPGILEERTIPFLYRRPGEFRQVMTVREGRVSKETWEALIHNQSAITVPAGEKVVVELDAGEEMCAYLSMHLTGGKDAKITMLQSEAYVQDGTYGSEKLPIKTDREDCVNGHLEGPVDTYVAAGDGRNAECNLGCGFRTEVIEPFWFRTFRFIKLTIETKEEPVTIEKFDFEETGYPLEVGSQVETSDESLAGIWDMSRRTLQRCMFETYVDCPFYEQLQYAMDSRAQMLYTYAVSGDDRLARQCMDDFRRSQRYDGLICSAYPSNKPNVIPGFSLFYIWMLHDHMMYFGDKNFLRKFLPSVEQILDFFAQHVTKEGYVGKVGGLLFQEPYWSFIDWAQGWEIGVPGAHEKGGLTMESLLYVSALQKTAQICDYLGRSEQAEEYLIQAEQVQTAIRLHCTGKDGMIQDGPGVELYSQHCQVFAALTETVSGGQARNNLQKTLTDRESYPQCTVAMCLYLFRALEKTDLYEYANGYWDIWRRMIDNHMTTSAESDTYCRSECHAWGALALYELPAIVLGVRPAKPGFEEVQIKPVSGHLSWAKGEVVTPKGVVHVSWEKKEEQLLVSYEAPEGLQVELSE